MKDCKGTNCENAPNGTHSPECFAEYERATGMLSDETIDRIASGKVDTKWYHGSIMKIAQELRAARVVLDKIDTLFDAIKHGDEEHQAWLKTAIEKHFYA